MQFNPYGGFNPAIPQKSPQELQAQLSSMMTQYQTLYGAPQQAGEKGEFVKVQSYDEVPDYPTNFDGTATLFFDFKNHVFWSKKFVNGGHSIQAFQFNPILNAAPQQDETDYTKVLEDVPDPREERLDKLEKMVQELCKKPKREATKDEI